MYPQADNGEDDGWWTVDGKLSIISPFGWVLCFLYIYVYIPHAVSIHIGTLEWSILSAMAAGDTIQTTPL